MISKLVDITTISDFEYIFQREVLANSDLIDIKVTGQGIKGRGVESQFKNNFKQEIQPHSANVNEWELLKENNEDIQLFSNVVLPSINLSNSGPVVLQEPVSPSLTGVVKSLEILNTTVYEFLVPTGTKRFELRSRQSSKGFKLSFSEADLNNGQYRTIETGNSWEVSDLQLVNASLFFQSDDPSLTIEMVFWT